MNLREKRWGSMNWINVAQGEVEGFCERGNESSDFIRCCESVK
jgi:hypothetical protein